MTTCRNCGTSRTRCQAVEGCCAYCLHVEPVDVNDPAVKAAVDAITSAARSLGMPPPPSTMEQTAGLVVAAARPIIVVEERERIAADIEADGDAHEGRIDPGRVRRALSNQHGLTVPPRMLSAAYSALRAQGVIKPDGWTVNTDTRGRNAGRPQRLWRLT